MYSALWNVVRLAALLALLLALNLPLIYAQSQNSLRGKITDPVARVVPDANITLLRNGKEVVHTKSDAQGTFEISVPDGGRYDIQIDSSGFATQMLPSVFIAGGKTTELPVVTLSIGAITQQVVVSATGTPVPDTQIGASVSVIDDEQ